jgi:hypothetical protein
MSVPNVLGIGSCRIFRPLRHLHEQGLVRLLNYHSHQWFTHTAAGAMQYTKLVRGQSHLPLSLRPAVLETEMKIPEDLVFDFANPDLVMVEVSTLKEHVLDGISLNAHKVYGLAVAAGVPYRPVINGITDALPDDHVLKAMAIHYATGLEVDRQLQYIRNELGASLLTVDHLYTETPDGLAIPERTKLSEILQGLQTSQGMAHFSTKTAIVAAGIDVALEDQNHYRKDFEPVVAGAMYSRIESLLALKSSVY